MTIKLKGIDVSKWQGNIDFKAVKASGVDFVIIRAGCWTNTDSFWERNYTNAKNNGLKVGAYWYSYALTVEQCRVEVKAFISALKGKQLDFPVFFDIEEKEQLEKGKEFCTDLANAFCSELEKAGYYAGIYGSTAWMQTLIDKSAMENRAVWIADYRGKCGYVGDYGIWQYGLGRVDGVSGDCDMDEGYIDYSEHIKKAGLNGYCKSDSTDIKKTIDELAQEVLNGLWSNGETRKQKLTAAGYDYSAVQTKVNEILYSKSEKKSVNEIAAEVVHGLWGNGEERIRKLTEAGYDYKQVQMAVNQIIYK